jgi:hypothetical protein
MKINQLIRAGVALGVTLASLTCATASVDVSDSCPIFQVLMSNRATATGS